MTDTLRKVALGDTGYTLETWDTGRFDGRMQTVIGYRFGNAEHPDLFTGEDFSGSPLHADDSDETLRALVGFLSLRRGDVEIEWFDGYTDDQWRFEEHDAEEISMWAHEECSAEFTEVEA